MWNNKRRPVRYYNSSTPSRSRPTRLDNSSHVALDLRRIPKKTKIIGLISALALSLALVMVVLLVFSNKATESTKKSENIAELPPKKEYKAIDETLLQNDITAIIAANPGLDIGVSIVDIRTSKQLTYGVDVPFIAASVGKILSACLLLHEVESGTYTLEQQIGANTARVQIQKMIGQSDNEAWHAINDELGHPALQAYAASVGVQNYDADKNTVTPSSVASLLDKLYSHKLLNQDNTSFLLANMQTDQEEVQFIRRYIDPATSVYHKAGWLDDRAHDTAIVEKGDRPYVLVVFSKKRFGEYDFAAGQKIFEELTTKVDATFSAAL